MAAMLWRVLAAVSIGLISSTVHVNGHCVERYLGYDSFVCVCNATHCDEPGIVPLPEDGTYFQVTTDRATYRVEPFSGAIEDTAGATAITINVNTSAIYQAILGFGGAFTDAAGESINSLSEEARLRLLRSYWAPEGNEYSIGRVPIGGTDMSSRPYTLDDVEGDVELAYWSLQPEDYNLKIPNVKAAMELSEQEILIFGSPWSPPIWMKSNHMFNGTGYLLHEYYQTYADYIVKWAVAYEAQGVPLWGLTPQNEPLDEEEDWIINSCRWHPEEMREWIRDFLGPSLAAAGYRRLKLMADDFNRYTLPYYVEPCFTDPECSQYVDGVAVHWYSDNTEPPEILLETRDLDPSKFILYSEACHADPQFGNWTRAEHYIFNILEDINHYAVGWVDWNQALYTAGGPHWIGLPLDSPVMVNSTADEFYKQPIFYALTHVSKFFKRGDLRIDAVPSDDSIASAAVVKADGSVAIVVANFAEEDTGVSIAIDSSRYINADLLAKSINSFLVPPA